MALDVSPGPLPQNYERVDAANFLEAFVNGTTVRNFPASSFDVSLNFITSQTDEPTSPNRGLLWFQRGAGQLRFLDDPDRGDSRYTASTFMCICPRREVILEAAHGGTNHPAYSPVVGRFSASPQVLFEYYRDINVRQTLKADPYFATVGVGRGMHSAWVATDTPVSGYPIRAVEWGYTPVWMASGVTSVAGKMLRASSAATLEDANGVATHWHCRYNTWSGESLAYNFGVVAYSSGATNEHLNVAFKRPVCDFWWGN